LIEINDGGLNCRTSAAPSFYVVVYDNIVRVGLNYQFHLSDYDFRNSSGGLAMLLAIFVSQSMTGERRLKNYQHLTGSI
jgi:hypothetical protein